MITTKANSGKPHVMLTNNKLNINVKSSPISNEKIVKACVHYFLKTLYTSGLVT